MIETRARTVRTLFCVLMLATAGTAAAQDTAAPAFTSEQLEQIVAPVALYPDSLLTQVLMASTYPLEVVEAGRWMARHKSVTGAALDEALKSEDWDASVKSLCHVPDVLSRMSDNLDWTQDLGDAFLSQKAELMDTVQRMRAKAYDAGNLETSEQQVVTQQADKIIVIESPSPEVVYVPSYSPTVVYGPAWSYPTYHYPAMYYPPPPGYGLLTFGVGMAVGAAVWGNCNWGWGSGDVDIDVNRYNDFNRNTNINADRERVNPNRGGNRADWQHDPSHRKGVNYPNQRVANRYGAQGDTSRVSRDQARGWSDQRGTGGAQARDRAAAGAGGRAPNAGQLDRPQPPSRGGASAGQYDRGGGLGAGQYDRGSGAGHRDTAYSGSRNSGFDRAASGRGATSRGTRSYGGGGSSFGGSHGGGGRGGGGGGGRGGGGGGRRR